MSEHALLAPSAAHRWVECPGSAVLAQCYPQEEGPEAREGTAAHWAMQEMLLDRMVAEGLIAENGVPLTREMIEAAEVLVDDVRATVQRATALGDAGIKVEQRVAIPRIHNFHCWGTPDVSGWLPGFTLHVWDFKYGHRVVDAFENWQLMCYVAGLLDAAKEAWMHQAGVTDERVKVVMTVVQPRAPHREGSVRRWAVQGADLRAYFNRLEMSAEVAMSPAPPTKAGPWCRDCAARRGCETLTRAAAGVMDDMGGITPLDLTPEQAGLELRNLARASEVLNARKAGLEEQVEHMLKAGKAIPFWRMSQEPGREVWTAPAAQVIAMGAMMEVDLAKPREALTPNQARKAGLAPELVATMASRPMAALKLVADDGREARQVFGSGS